jgi:ABC-type uncharacterized transport system permease subunit
VPELTLAWRRLLRWPALVPVVAVALALAVCFIAILLTGKDAVGGYLRLLDGAVGGRAALGETAVKTAVLTCTGLSVGVAYSVGLFNIGAEGQFIAGALGAAVAGLVPGLPPPLHLVLALVAAAACGALPALLAAWLKARRGVHEVISTIMLNWTVIYLVQDWLVVGPLRTPSASAEVSAAGTPEIFPSAFLPRLLEGSRLDLGFPLAVLLAVGAWVLLRRTVVGYELRAVGHNAEAARTAGITVARRLYLAMGLAGALAGIGGALLILGTEHRFPGVFRTGYGFDGIAVALIGSGHPLGVLLSAGFFGALRAGATRLQLVGIHTTFAELIQGAAVLFVAGRVALSALLERLSRVGERP